MASSPAKHQGAVWTRLFASRARTAVFCVIALLAILRVGAPFALKHLVEVETMAALDRPVALGAVDLSILAGVVGLDRLYVGPPLDGAAPSGRLAPGDVRFGARRIEVDVSMLDLLRGDVRVEAVLIDTPRLLRLRDLAGSLPPLLRAAAAEEAVEIETSDDGAGPPISLNRLRVVNASFAYFDLAQPEREPLEVTLGALELGGMTLVDGEIEIETVAIREPALRVLNDFGVAALRSDADAAAEDAQPAAEAGDGSPPSSPRLRIGRLTLSDAEFALLQAGDGGALDTELDLEATDVSLDAGARFPVELTLTIESGSVTANGRAGVQPIAFDGAVGWEALPLAEIARALGPLFPAQLTSGASSGELKLELSLGAESGGAIQVSGRGDVTDFALSDGQGVDIGWQELAVVIDELAIDPSGERAPKLSLASLSLLKPYLMLLLTEREAMADAPPAEAEARPPLIRIAEMDVSGGTLRFEDATVNPRHRSEVRDLVLRGRDLRWPERVVGALKIEGRSDGESAISADGALGSEQADLEFVLSGLALEAFSPYIADAAGYWVEGGQADLEAKLSQRGAATDVDSALVLRRLSVTSVTPGTFQKRFGVPLDVGLALLRDPKGNIRLPIAFRLEGDTSRVDLVPIVLASLQQALIGALTSPLKAVGLLLESGDGESDAGMALEPVAFEPGSVELPAAADIARFGELLSARSGLALRLRGRVSPDDARGIAEQVLIARAVADDELPASEAGFLQRRRIVAALKQRAAGDAGELDANDSAALAQWLDSIPTSASDRDAFAQRRVQALRAALLELPDVEDAQISLGHPVDGAPGVVIELAPKGA